LAEEVKQLKARLDLLELKALLQSTIDLLKSSYSAAEFDPTDSSFQRLDAISGVGSFAVSVNDVRDFGDGVRVFVRLGNMTAATIVGATLKLTYGPRKPAWEASPEYSARLDEWKANLKEKDEVINANLRPGSWNPVTVTLPDLDQKNFGYLQMKIETKTISLSGN
jgi:hypothetical protein